MDRTYLLALNGRLRMLKKNLIYTVNPHLLLTFLCRS